MLSRLVRKTTRLTVKVSLVSLALLASILIIGAFVSRSKPGLRPWHLGAPRGEFRALLHGDDFSFEDYLNLEALLFSRLAAFEAVAEEQGRGPVISRYMAGGPASPKSFDRNWNRTFELAPREARGAALLLHGLSDSPYSLRGVGELLYSRGYRVLGLRLPGHGTTPAALLTVQWRDWSEAVDLAARYLTSQLDDDLPFLVAGYSCGGALALEHTARTLLEGGRRLPDGLVLFSPAVEITALARASNWNKFLAWVPYFEKDKWSPLQPEYDPFKYNSFAKNAGAQMFSLTKRLRKDLNALAAKGLAEDFPPMLTFQSAVDATVVGRGIVDRLYDTVGAGSRLVVFDVNRAAYVEEFFTRDPGDFFRGLLDRGDLPYSYTLVSNASPDSLEVAARSRLPGKPAGHARPLGASWPPGVFSLSHVAVPFPPDDPVYGAKRRGGLRTIQLGTLAPRGERGVLNVPADQLMRLRYNPFFPYVADEIERFLDLSLPFPEGKETGAGVE